MIELFGVGSAKSGNAAVALRWLDRKSYRKNDNPVPGQAIYYFDHRTIVFVASGDFFSDQFDLEGVNESYSFGESPWSFEWARKRDSFLTKSRYDYFVRMLKRFVKLAGRDSDALRMIGLSDYLAMRKLTNS